MPVPRMIMRMTIRIMIIIRMIITSVMITRTITVIITSMMNIAGTGIPMLMTTNSSPPAMAGGMTEREAAALYRLMTWLSPSFPVGGFSYSSGIEWAVEAGDITDAISLREWLAAMLTDGSGFCDGLFMVHAHRAAEAGEEARLRELA